jgi:AcrR family transcriptional regulator
LRVTAALPIEVGRAARTRNALLEAGFELLVDRPIDLISINDLVAAADVAKGSFFNHFDSKHEFAEIIATDLRAAMEKAIKHANAKIADPVEWLAQGIQVPVESALSQPQRARVMLRMAARTTIADHPLNRGVAAMVKACVAQGALRSEAANSGMIFWLGLCHVLTRNVVERDLSRAKAADEVRNILFLGLRGLGIEEKRVRQLAVEGRANILKASFRPHIVDGPLWKS